MNRCEENPPAVDEEIDRGTHSQQQMVEAHLSFFWLKP